MIWAQSPAVVRVPATSANLGPGFDAFGLALALYDQVEARVTGSGLSVAVHGDGEETAGAGERHLVVRAMRAAFDAMGGQPGGIAMRCVNAIPHGRGFGSSAAAALSGCPSRSTASRSTSVPGSRSAPSATRARAARIPDTTAAADEPSPRPCGIPFVQRSTRPAGWPPMASNAARIARTTRCRSPAAAVSSPSP